MLTVNIKSFTGPKLFKSASIVTLLLIISVGSGLRVYHLNQRGVIEHDEAAYLLSSQLYSRSAAWFIDNLHDLQTGDANFSELKASIIGQGGGTQNMSAKPLHILLTSTVLWITAFNATSALYLQAILGILTILLLLEFGRKLFNLKTGILAALFLAISSYHINYSRAALSQVESAFFVLLGAYFFFQSSLKQNHTFIYLFLGGLGIGLGFTAHYNLFWELPLIVIYETWAQYKKKNFMPKRYVVLLAGIASPILGFELILRAVAIAISRISQGGVAGLRFRTYFEQIYDQIVAGVRYSTSPDLLFYGRALWKWEGALVSILILVGLVFLVSRFIRDKKLSEIIVVSQFLIPISIWSLSSLQYPRNILVAVPFASLIAAIGLLESMNFVPLKPSYRRMTLIVAIVAILSVGFAIALPQIHGTSGYAAAANQLRQYAETHPGTVVAKKELGLSTDPLWRFYLGNLVDYDAEQGTVFVLDRSAYTSSGGNTRALLEQARCAQEIIRVKNDITWYMTGDSPTNPPEQMIQQIPEANEIRFYDRRLANNCP